MKVICRKKIIRNDRELKEVETLRVEQKEYPEVTIGKEYRVMGLMLPDDRNCLYYLVDDNDRTWWCPYMLFEISDNSLPDNWYIKVSQKEYLGGIYYLSGFYELCNDDNYYVALIEREYQAEDVYFKRKREYEQEEEYQYLIELGKKGV